MALQSRKKSSYSSFKRLEDNWENRRNAVFIPSETRSRLRTNLRHLDCQVSVVPWLVSNAT